MPTIAEEWLNSCAGCEIALLNLGETLLDLLPQLEFVHIPVLADNKYFGPLGRRKRLSIPRAVVGIVSGGVRNSEHLEVLQEMRRQVDVLVALGTCAVTGGLPGLADLPGRGGAEGVRDFVFRQSPSTVSGSGPQAGNGSVPDMLPRCTCLAEHVKVDLAVPGCPPHPDWIAEAVLSLLEGRPAVLPDRSVCSICPTRRTGSGDGRIRRMLEQPVYAPDKPLSEMQCLLEQGFLCLGPVTLAGCGGRTGAPKCIAGRAPCRGCQGPVPHMAMPFADYMAALAAAGIDGTAMIDKPGYLSRFNAAHRLLQKLEVR